MLGLDEAPDHLADPLLALLEVIGRDLTGGIGWLIGLALVAHLLRVLVRARGWQNILAAAVPDSPPRYAAVLRSQWIGLAVNGVVPARGGDVAKVAWMRREVPDVPMSTVGATQIVDELFEVGVGVLLIVLAIAHGASLTAPTSATMLAGAAGLGALVLAVAALTRIGAVRRVVARELRRVADGLRLLGRPRTYIRRVLGWQLAETVLRFTTIMLLLAAFGLPADPLTAGLVLAAGALGNLIPVTPAGAGATQAAVVVLLAGVAPPATLLAFGIAQHVLLVGADVVAGALVAAGATAARALRGVAARTPAVGPRAAA